MPRGSAAYGLVSPTEENSIVTANTTINAWVNEIQGKARSGDLTASLRSVYGSSALEGELVELVAALASGDRSVLPTIQWLDSTALQGRLGAYSPQTETIYVSQQLLEFPDIALEVLTHEWAHALAQRYFEGQEQTGHAYGLTRALLGKDHALVLSSPNAHAAWGAHDHADSLVLPGEDAGVSVQWFDTALHIDWAREQLPMLNAQAFDLLKLGQNDSDAFLGVARVGVFSPYGLQTDSSTHFDNNNVRGSIESMRKRWSHGIDQLDETLIRNPLPVPFMDKALVGPNFEGANAGVENLLYRFGQITHAFQDFYSHSNWIEMVRAGADSWITSGALLDQGLDLPTPLNPGSYIASAPGVMVAMSGPDHDPSLKLAGIGIYATGPKSVYWWVNDRQDGWGQVFANPQAGGSVGGLMTGAVNEAVYYDTDYSVPLRAVDRENLADKEYYRGFSHGGVAGAFVGQWMSPLSKDKSDNGRFVDKAANKVLFEEAQAYAGWQVQHDFDRMGNLISKNHGVDGLQKFADFALVESAREQFVSTYSQPGGRWDWDGARLSLDQVRLFLATVEESGHEAGHFHFDESKLRFVEVFYADEQASFTSNNNRTYLTQVNDGGRWWDIAAGVINTHHDHLEDYGPEAFLPAAVQHVSAGGRALWSESNQQEGHYLGTVYFVANVNTAARVYVNQFDVDFDELHVVDEQGNLVEVIDVDRADYPEVRQYLVDTYNIILNARPEAQTLSQAMVIRSDQVHGSVVIQAADFFASADATHAREHDPAAGKHSAVRFASHDETHSWLRLRDNGTLEITDIDAVPKGVHKVYVSVTDEAGLLEGAMITLAIDPQVRVAGQAYDTSTQITLDFRDSVGASALGLFAQVFGEQGNPVSFVEHLGVRLGQASGLPEDFDAGLISTNLSDAIDHGDLVFFALDYDTQTLHPLDLLQSGTDQFVLSRAGQAVADVSLGGSAASSYIDEIYFVGLEDVRLGIPLTGSWVNSVTGSAGQPTEVRLDASVIGESAYAGEFGFIVAHAQSGHLIDPRSGVGLKSVNLSYDTVSDYSVYSVRSAPGTVVQGSGVFSLDPDLNLNNIVLLPYYKVQTDQGSQLFMGGASGARNGLSHVVRVDRNTFGVEDLISGDYDFDDALLTVNAITVTDYI